ncbi:MAG: hypothetical protein AB7O65_03785 [Candidatus Korobacteraceae bacterium]
MRFPRASVIVTVTVLALLLPSLQFAQDADRSVAGGGITAPGWQGRIDAAAAQKGMKLADSKFEKQGSGFLITTGPAGSYWNPTNMAKGDYTVKATFKEAKQTYNHPHPYGVFIGGSNLDSDQFDQLYCVAYRDGTFLVRQFGDGTVSTLIKRQPNEAVNKAAGPEAPVTQEVAWTVKGGRAECSINGKVVAGFNKDEIVGAGKLESTDGIAGIRVTHNSDIEVASFSVGN